MLEQLDVVPIFLKKFTDFNISKRVISIIFLMLCVSHNFLAVEQGINIENWWRIIVCIAAILMILRFVGVYQGRILLFGVGVLTGVKKFFFYTYLCVSVIAVLGLLFQQYIVLSSFLLFFLNGIYLVSTKTAGVNETLTQNFLFHFFLIAYFYEANDQANCTYSLVSLFNTFGILLFSASFEKINFRNYWCNGKGIIHFFGMPNHIRYKFSFLNEWLKPAAVFWSTLLFISQFGFIASSFSPVTFYIFIGFTLLFGAVLILVTNISYLGFWVVLFIFLFAQLNFGKMEVPDHVSKHDVFPFILLGLNFCCAIWLLFCYSFPKRKLVESYFYFLLGFIKPMAMFNAISIIVSMSYKITWNDQEVKMGFFNSDGTAKNRVVITPPCYYVLQFWHLNSKALMEYNFSKDKREHGLETMLMWAVSRVNFKEGQFAIWKKGFEVPIDFKVFRDSEWKFFCSANYTKATGLTDIKLGNIEELSTLLKS